MRHYRRISVIHAAGSKLLRVSDQKKLARCLNGCLETRSALTKGISSLCTAKKLKRIVATQEFVRDLSYAEDIQDMLRA